MWKHLSYLVLLLLAARPVAAQKIEPLHHLIGSNSLIERPQTFRDLQDAIDKQWSGLDNGARLELLDDKLKALRERILKPFDTINVEAVPSADAPTGIAISFQDLRITIPLVDRSLDEALDKAAADLTTQIDNLLNRAARSTAFGLSGVQPGTLRGSIDQALLTALSQTQGKSSTNVQSAIAAILQSNIRTMLEEVLRRMAPNFDPYDRNAWRRLIGEKREIPADTLVSVIRRSITKTRETLADGLNSAEHRLRGVVDEFSRWLVAGNAGVAVTKGEGAFAGGVHISYNQSQALQLGLYINGSFQANSSSTETSTVIGGQIRYGLDAFQVDLLLSGIRGTAWAMESGIGFSARIREKTVLGLSVFNLLEFNAESDALRSDWSAALSVKAASPESPMLIAGVTFKDSKPLPLFQIVYPITAE